MLVTSKAIVFSSVKFSEADLVVKCFTHSHGLKSYLLRNILKSKKGKLKASMFQVLTQLEIVATHKEKDTLEYIKEAKVINSYQSFHLNIYKSTMVLFLSEVLRNSIQEEEANIPLYEFLESNFNWLDKHEDIANFHLVFLLQLTRYLGFFPKKPDQPTEFFNLLDGTFQNMDTNEYCIGNENVQVLSQLLQTNFDNQDQIKLNQKKRSGFLQMMLTYYNLHLQNFRKPKSLVVLSEIFQ